MNDEAPLACWEKQLVTGTGKVFLCVLPTGHDGQCQRDLVEFLLARIAEEEAAVPPEYASEDWGGSGFNADPIMFEVTPRRWLVECEAKRRIVERHQTVPVAPGHSDFTCLEDGSTTWPCPTLRLLALPYADHPDYDDAWRI